VKDLDICYKLKNTEIDDYKVIIEYGKKHANSWDSDNRKWEIEPNTKECIKCSDWRGGNVYLLDKNINIEDITEENINDTTIFV
jgi:hypothetical protein